MIVVIIAGGSGTRLWPLSTHSYPKHLLTLTGERSLLQHTFIRARLLTSLDKILVVSEASHIEHVKSQLNELDQKNILCEPARRGTASCLMLALAEIKSRKLPDEPVFFLWADHLVRDSSGFAASILRAGSLAAAEERPVFIGVEPTYPSTGFGYMERSRPIEGWQDAYDLASFHEKPDKKVAERYFSSGKYYWNTGYLMGTLKTFEREMRENVPSLWTGYKQLLTAKSRDEAYLELDPQPIDTALSEKVTDGIVVPGNFDWADIGSFRDLHGISSQDDNGNHVSGDAIELENTTNSYIRNDGGTPVAVIGLDNVVVVTSRNGVLVTNKNFAQNVGDVAKKLQA